jgi:hypothetical protein
VQIGEARAEVIVQLLQERIIEGAHQLELTGEYLARRERAHEVDRRRPPLAARRGRLQLLERCEAVVPGFKERQGSARDPRPDAGQQLEHAKSGDPVAGVLGEAQYREHIFDVRALDELEPAELDEGDVAAAELELEAAAVMAGAEQYRLLAEFQAGLAVLGGRAAPRSRPDRSRRAR